MGSEMTPEELAALAATPAALRDDLAASLTKAKRHTERVQHSSKFPNWRTPTRLFAALDHEFCFVLDAAAEKENKLCPHYFGPDHTNPALRDALKVDWADYIASSYAGTYHPFPRMGVFVNPPYSREHKMPIGPWVEKCWLESQKGLTIVGVIPYSPQTEWWRRWVEGQQEPEETLATFHAARETRKIPHRVTFLRPDGSVEGNAGGNTAIVVWKPRGGIVAPWVPWAPYWDYEEFGLDGAGEVREP